MCTGCTNFAVSLDLALQTAVLCRECAGRAQNPHGLPPIGPELSKLVHPVHIAGCFIPGANEVDQLRPHSVPDPLKTDPIYALQTSIRTFSVSCARFGQSSFATGIEPHGGSIEQRCRIAGRAPRRSTISRSTRTARPPTPNSRACSDRLKARAARYRWPTFARVMRSSGVPKAGLVADRTSTQTSSPGGPGSIATMSISSRPTLTLRATTAQPRPAMCCAATFSANDPRRCRKVRTASR